MYKLRSQQQATIINITSVIAFMPMPEMPLYCATKAALHSYTMALREQLAKTTVKVVEVIPPAVETDINLEHRDGLLKEIKLVSAKECASWIVAGLNRGDIDIAFKPPKKP
jgi:uncharacterized oxidoreductase